jgi:hypothetical protein
MLRPAELTAKRLTNSSIPGRYAPTALALKADCQLPDPRTLILEATVLQWSFRPRLQQLLYQLLLLKRIP